MTGPRSSTELLWLSVDLNIGLPIPRPTLHLLHHTRYQYGIHQNFCRLRQSLAKNHGNISKEISNPVFMTWHCMTGENIRADTINHKTQTDITVTSHRAGHVVNANGSA